MPPRARDDEPIDAELVVGQPSDAELVDGDPAATTPARPSAEPPVVARLVIEIRSDGSRTIARGAMEDVASGQSVALEARGDSPLSLALSLARSMASLPSLARTAARALRPSKRRLR
jgi:hypothetical protein